MKKFKEHIKDSTTLTKSILQDPNKHYPQFKKLWDRMKSADKALDRVSKRIDWDADIEPGSTDVMEYDYYVNAHNDALTKIKEMVADLPGGSEEDVIGYLNDGVTDSRLFWNLCLGVE